jgi:dimethlysulfoniopropionate lyase
VNDELHESATWLISAVARSLASRSDEGISEVLDRLGAQDLSIAALRQPEPRNLPACRYFPETAAATMMVASPVSAALADIEPHLRWKQNSNYSDAVLGEGYMNSYAYSEIIGPDGFFPGDDYLMGLLLLGPGRHYRDHRHPAPELYWTLTGPSLWRRAPEEYQSREAGSSIWHPPCAVHATRTLTEPLLAVWIWTRDTSAPAVLAG